MAKTNKSRLSMRGRHIRDGLIFISPWIIGCAIFFIYPLFYSLMLAFGKIINPRDFTLEFVGIENFRAAFFDDGYFVPKLLGSMGELATRLPLIIVLSLIIAVMVNKDIACRGFFRSVFFLPVLLGSGFVMEQLLGQGVDQQVTELARGIVMPEQLMAYLPPMVSSAITSFFNIITMVLWESGVQILIFLAGLQNISTSVYESAYVDGANEWDKFWKLTVPMLLPTFLLNIVYTVVDACTDANNGLIKYMSEIVFGTTNIRFELSAAMSWVYCLFILAVIGLFFLILRKLISRNES